MMQILSSINTYLWFSLFFGMSYGLKKCSVRESLSNTIPSLSHSIISTLVSSIAILNYNDEIGLLAFSISFGYFMTDSIFCIQLINQPGRKILLVHHIAALISLSMPPNQLVIICLFLTESSNIPNQITYLLIKLKAPSKNIFTSKHIQYYSFFICRIVLFPLNFMLTPLKEIPMESTNMIYFLFSGIFLMSIFWMHKLHKSFYK
jgi:hypothetical protein